MTEHHEPTPEGLTVHENEGLIGIVVADNGQQATQFFAESDETRSDAGTRAALQAIGAWSDLDWDEAVEELDRIQHESKPSPPLDL